jgi:hypothetical protein
VFENLGNWKCGTYCQGIGGVGCRGARKLKVWGKSAETLELFENMGLGVWKFGKKC